MRAEEKKNRKTYKHHIIFPPTVPSRPVQCPQNLHGDTGRRDH